jgi:hypothetical protein
MEVAKVKYPKRSAFHAHRLTRLLFKSCAAQSIGHHAVCLVIHIAHTEDAARYQGAVRFWNSQFMEVLGFTSPKQLTKARQMAIESGWLHYHRETTRAVGHYWTLIPKFVEQFNDAPIEEISPAIHSPDGMNEAAIHSPSGTNETPIHSPGGTHSGMNCGTQSGNPSNPIPTPNPKARSSELERANSSKPKGAYTTAFEDWYQHYPKKKSKGDAAKAYPNAIKRIQGQRGCDRGTAVSWLIEQTKEFSQSISDGDLQFTKYPASWLNSDAFNDDLESQNQESESSLPMMGAAKR